jgi:murein DD-endopeptidase MepM/ murein hydrolase activator NlpD
MILRMKIINIPKTIIIAISLMAFTCVGILGPELYAATRGQIEDSLRRSEWTDGESSVCSSTTSVTQSSNISTPGLIYMIGDSIGEGIATELGSDLQEEDGWTIQPNNRVGRPISEGIEVAQSSSESILSAQYVLIVLGSNPDNKLNEEGVQEMVQAVRSAPSTIPIVWLGTNITRPDISEGALAFNTILRRSDQIRYIENSISPGSDQLHPESYAPLSELVANAFKSGSTPNIEQDRSGGACVCNFGNPTGLNVDKNFTLGSEGEERRINLIKYLIGDYDLTAEQAAGVLGNFMEESGGYHLPPDVNEGGSPGPPRFSGGYGWAQWTGSRQRSFIDFAVEAGFMNSENENATDAANYAYLKKELAEGYKETIPELKNNSTPEDAAVSFEATYERAGVPRMEDRKASARRAFEEYAAGASSGSTTSTGSGSSCTQGQAAIVGDSAFPLLTTKTNISNPGIFRDGTTSQGGHPYIAYDISTEVNTPVAAFISGKVTSIDQDKCPGRLISIYNSQLNLTVSYLHLAFDNHVALDDEVLVGQQIGLVGSAANGCSVPHLHIDAVEGTSRPGCSRENCSDASKRVFRDIGSPLFETFQRLAE